MAEPPAKRDAKSLVRSLLASNGAPVIPAEPGDGGPGVATPAETAVGGAAPADDLETEARTLIEVYFDCEDPTERDVVFEKLAAIDTPSVTAFLRAMMTEDEDEVARAGAATELARRGDAGAIAALEADLAEPEELFFFENAVEGLAAAKGPAFYDTLRGLWQDPARDGDERRQAMLAMESLDPERALADFATFVATPCDPAALLDDQVEVAIMAFVRHAHRPGRDALVALRDRIAAARGLDGDEREELAGFVQEGIDLFDAGA